ncbi:HtaA domain-containing protein [Georgenia daeguensis]|uniref:Htaa domain-containing protein n=1 Tax=Georgenia daeguensis TaxID=908355 RepID=A0ABP8EY31_9MICO
MTTTAGLTWAVKESLVSYVEALDDGVVEAVAPATRSEAGFFFPTAEPDAGTAGEEGASGGPADGAPSADRAGHALQFRGAVRLTGHWGMLDVELRDPSVELDGDHGTLFVRERGSRDARARLPLADLTVGATTTEPGPAVVQAAASLTGHGRLLLGGQYAVGEPLSPVLITLPARRG